ncbi:hypothetical protein O998_06075 [Anaplasma phagocytophilum str. Norway variant1]|uniref:Uncharacterized protein n=1 Tax=Anaplasma phagocytophilum str. Norway variant1 TaxID=1392506 RepID=A0A7H9E0D5_ANAPH|nr:hypothetical protein [Anaplasma phagocytophilum]QLL67210.1 hypothetical protein O998_06075 [Anaplasma phagocytophilum str. Norway variant1]
MYGIDIELGDYRIGSETISSGDDGYYEGCACDKDASTNAYSYDKCRVVRGTWRPSELVLYVGDEHVACRDVSAGMHQGHLPGKVYFIESEAGRAATAEGGVYTTVVEALSLVQEEDGTGMYLINAPEKAVVRFFKIEKSTEEEPQTVDPGVVESATGSGVDTQEEQEIDHEAPAIGVEKTDADVAQKEVISGQQEQEIAEVLDGPAAPVEAQEETEVSLQADTAMQQEAGISDQETQVTEEVEKVEVSAETKTEEPEVILEEGTLIDLEQPVAQVPVVAEAELPGVEAAEAIVPSLEENKLPEVVVAPEAQQLESAPEVSAPVQPESEGDLKSEVSVEANAGMQQEAGISDQETQVTEEVEKVEASVETKTEEPEVILEEGTLIDLEQPVAQVPVVAEAELPGVEAAEAIVPSLEENKLPEVVVAPEAQQLESAPEVSAPAQPESAVLGVTEGDLKSEVSVEANAGMQQEAGISDQETQVTEEVEKVEVSVETKTEEPEVILEEGTLIDLEQPVAQVPVVAEAELPGVEAAEAIVPSLEENKLPEVVVAPEAQQLESAPEVSAPAQPESAVLGVTEGDLKSEVSVEANAGMQQEIADVPTALPLKDPEDEDVLNYLLARK